MSGELELSLELPNIARYQYRWIHKSIESKTGFSFLLHSRADAIGNKWRDTEQYELDTQCSNFLVNKLGIYR